MIGGEVCMYAKVIVDIKVHSVDKVFDYIVPDDLDVRCGMRVRVPFGRRELDGYVIEVLSEIEETKFELKSILGVSDVQFLNQELIDLAVHFAAETGSFKTSMLQTMLPKDITNRKAKDIEWITGFNDAFVSVKAKKQQEVIDYLEAAALPIRRSQLNQIFGASVIRTMMEKEVLQTKHRKENFLDVEPLETTALHHNNITLRDEQLKVLKALDEAPHKTFLLEGVTGSGKTEVFLTRVARVLQEKKTAMILVPEIGLTPQMIERFEARFGKQNIGLLHSRLTPAKRFDMWRRIKSGQVQIVLGTRSAIFAPLENIGIIILDEEHDQSYKQDNMPTYHARDIAIWRAQKHQAQVILASATPSLESFVRAEKGIYEYVRLQERINANQPEVEIVDMTNYLGEIEHRYFSRELLEAIQTAIEKNEQVILLLNRRGYAPMMQCKVCGHIPECPNCDTSLVYHQNKRQNSCHYCDYTESHQSTCAECGSDMRLDGIGIQRIEQELKKVFETARIIRADRDTIKKLEDYEALYEEFRKHEADILLGTQMITKGFDFPNVTVVGILETDQILHMPDVRASEKAYQLLRQAIGRTGRSEKKGKAILQTLDADHPLFVDIQKDDYQGFARKELERRQQFENPPFWHMSDIIISSETQNDAASCAAFMYTQLQRLEQYATVYQPAPTFMARRNNKYYFHILLKYKNSQQVIKNVQKLIEHVTKNYGNVQSFVQVNPVTFL